MLFQREDASLKYASNESSLKQHSRFGETGRRSAFDELGNSRLPGEIGCPPKFHPNGFSAGILDPVRHIGYPAEQPCGERSSPARRGQYKLAYSDPKNGCSPECRKRSGRRYFQIDLLSPPKMILGAVDGKRIGLLRQDRTVRGKVDRLMKAIVAVPTKRSSTSNQQKPGAEKRPVTAEKGGRLHMM